MYIPSDYSSAVALMFVTMLCWGSWANTQKLSPNWRFELFYWDYVLGVLATSIVLGLLLAGKPAFVTDALAAAPEARTYALGGGMIFNVANLLLVAAISIAGMAVAFPIAIGIALVLGTALSYWLQPSGDARFLMMGVAMIFVAIILDAKAYKKLSALHKSTSQKGIWISIISGLLMGSFYPLVARSMEGVGALDPYTALLWFSIGVYLCNFVANTWLMRKPIAGAPVSFSQYFQGTFTQHLTGILGGAIWCVGMGLNIVAAQQAGPAVAYAFGQGATLIAAIWGVFVWREFKGVNGVNALLFFMFVSYILGLALIGAAKLGLV